MSTKKSYVEWIAGGVGIGCGLTIAQWFTHGSITGYALLDFLLYLVYGIAFYVAVGYLGLLVSNWRKGKK